MLGRGSNTQANLDNLDGFDGFGDLDPDIAKQAALENWLANGAHENEYPGWVFELYGPGRPVDDKSGEEQENDVSESEEQEGDVSESGEEQGNDVSESGEEQENDVSESEEQEGDVSESGEEQGGDVSGEEQENDVSESGEEQENDVSESGEEQGNDVSESEEQEGDVSESGEEQGGDVSESEEEQFAEDGHEERREPVNANFDLVYGGPDGVQLDNAWFAGNLDNDQSSDDDNVDNVPFYGNFPFVGNPGGVLLAYDWSDDDLDEYDENGFQRLPDYVADPNGGAIQLTPLGKETLNGFKKKQHDQMGDGFCTICLEQLGKEAYDIACGHLFCAECMEQLAEYTNLCPCCRVIITPKAE